MNTQNKQTWKRIFAIIFLTLVGMLLVAPHPTVLAQDGIATPAPLEESNSDDIQTLSCTPGNQVDKTVFFTAVLQMMNIPVTQFALDAFAAWLPYENTAACWNPLATTYHVAWFPSGTGCTETIFNGAGVRNYSSAYCGELATARTLLYSGSGNYYRPIREMLSLTTFNWQSLHDSIKLWVGSESYATSITNRWQTLWNNNTTPSLRDADFVSQSVPSSMIAGQNYTVSVTMKNTGSRTWTRASNFNLGSQNPRDNTVWRSSNRVYLSSSESISTGQSKTFTFTVTAPSTPGTYNFQWQMVQDGVAWFGDKSTNRSITITTGPPSTPTNFRVSSHTQNSLTLSWSNVANESGYKIYKWNGYEAFVYYRTLGANTTTYGIST